MSRRRPTLSLMVALCGMAVLLIAHRSLSATAITGMAIQAGPKGLALVIDADGALSGKYVIETRQWDGEASTRIRISLPECAYGLATCRFTDFAEGSPVHELLVTPREESRTVDMVLKIGGIKMINAESRLSGNRLAILIARSPLPDFSWKTPGPAQTRGADRPAAAQPVLEDVGLISRGNVTRILLRFTEPAEYAVRREDRRLVILFPGARSGLPSSRYALPENSLATGMEMTMKRIDGTDVLGVFVSLAGRRSCYLARDGSALAITRGDDGDGSIQTVWSALSGEAMGTVFTAGNEGPAAAAGETAVAARPDEDPAAPPYRLAAIRDRVNVRQSPSTAAGGNIVGEIPLGSMVSLIEKQGPWYRISDGKLTGWAHGSMFRDSARVPPEIWLTVRRDRPGGSAESAVAGITTGQLSRGVDAMAAAVNAKEAAQPRNLRQSTVDTAVPPVADAKPDTIRYRVYGRDPFLPFNWEDDTWLANPDNLELVGIIYDSKIRVAMLEERTDRERYFALREKDPVENGTVWRITQTGVVFLLTELGISRSYTLELKRTVSARK